MFGNRNVEDEIRKAQEERKRHQREAMQQMKGVAFGSTTMDDEIYGSTRPSRTSASESFGGYDVFRRQEEMMRKKRRHDGGGGDDDGDDHSNAFERAVKQRYTAPQKFLEETASIMERSMEGDVFDSYRRKTVAETESDYQARWRKRKLSPEREDPFAAAIKAKKDKRRGARKNRKSNAADAASNAGDAAADQKRRSYVEVMREVQLEREIRDTEFKLRKIAKEKERTEKLRREYGDAGVPDDDNEQTRRAAYPHHHEDTRNDDNNGSRARQHEGRGSSGRDGGGGSSSSSSSSSTSRAGAHRRGGERGRQQRQQYEWGRPELLLAEEEEKRKQRDMPVERPSLETSGKLVEESNATTTGVVLKWTPPPEIRPPTRRWRLYVLRNGEPCQSPIALHEQSYFLFGRDRQVVDVPTDHLSCSKQHSVICFRQVVTTEDELGLSEQRTVVKPYIIDLASTNGTFLNDKRIDDSRYYELKEFDVIKFGESTRDYVLLHEESHFSRQ